MPAWLMVEQFPGGIVLWAALVLLGIWFGWRAHRLLQRFRMARSRGIGRRGERIAEKVLARGGYVVLQRQVTASVRLIVDGVPCGYSVRADALVARGDRVFVAEFKGGEHVSQLSNRSTRRQLLEYSHAFGVRGVLLVDAYRRRIHEVAFEEASTGAELMY